MTCRSVRSIALLVAVVVTSRADAQAGRFDLEKTKSVLSSMIQKAIAERGVPSISIALVRGDSIVWKAAFGYANVRTGTPATPETIYSTGSTFKSATATALMQLVDQGKVGLDQPVNRYLGDVQVQDRLQAEKPVTVRHMLSHWSGLTAGATTKDIWGRELPKSLERMVAALYSVRPPEAKWEYNNFAYGMAGLVVEKVSGVEYEKYMVENVLKPLGITTPHPVYPSPEMVELMALPYLPGGSSGKPQAVAQVHFDVYPAGDIYLTAEDMARFLGAHLNGGTFQGHRILSEASIRQTHEAQFGGAYAFGWGVKKEASGHTILSHSGGIPGQSSMMMGDLDARVGVYYMSNSGAPPQIGEAALALLRGEDYTPPVDPNPVAVDPKVLDRYVGSYQLGEGTILVVRQGAGLAIRQESEANGTELIAESPTRFLVKGAKARIVFVTDSSGAVEQLVIEGDTDKTVAKRKK